MKISEASIKRPVSTAMMYALAMLLGVVAMFKLPLEFMPSIDSPYMEVIVPYEGASPVEICDQIAEPIEESISTLPGIDKLRSRCRQDFVYIGIELDPSTNMDYMVLDLQERIDQVRSDLPSDVRNIMINKFDTEQFPVIFGAVTMAEDSTDNNELVDRYLIRPLKTVEGVADIQIEGLEERRILVEMNEDRLTNYGISVLQVFDALTSSNLTLSAGQVEYAGRNHSVRIVGEFQDLEEIRDLPITSAVRLRDVADVSLDYDEPFFIGRLNKRRAFIMFVLKESGANTVEVCEATKDRLAELLEHPRLEGVKTQIWFDQSREITQSIDILTNTGIVGALLAFAVLWVFLKSFRSTAIVSVAIPMSILTTIALMYFVGLSFNVITLSALIVGVGMLVDNAIVVLEAIDLRHRQGYTPLEAAKSGASEVGLAITVATSTTIIVFLPLIFSEESAASVLMKQLGMVLAIAIFSSLLVSLTLIPLLAARLFTAEAITMPGWFRFTNDFFIAMLKRGLSHRVAAMGIVIFAFFVCIQILIWPLPWSAAIEDFPTKKLIEKEAIPSSLLRVVRITVKFEHKPPLEEIDEKMGRLEDMFMAKREEWDVDTVAAIVTPMFTRILLVLPDDRTPRHSAEEVKDMANVFLEENAKWPGVTFDTEGESQGGGPPGASNSTSIKVRGPDPDQVYSFAKDIRGRILDVEGLKEIKEIETEGEKELHVLVDRFLARKYGFETSSVAMSVSYAIRGVLAGQMLSGEEPLDIYIQVKDADKKTPGELETMNIQNMRQEYIPLKNIADFKTVPIPEVIKRDNRLITVRIPIVPEGRDLGEVYQNISRRLANYRLPMGYSWVMGEEYQERNEDLMTLAKAILLAMALVFLLMTAQFESFFLPFVIMFTLPFALIGVVLALLVSRATLNVLSGAGCLLLVGIVVNNAIVLVDHIHNLRKKGLGERESLLQAADDRFRPIMMTALTTIVGLFPMALGLNDTSSMVYSPLAIAVLGGLFASTFLTPFIIPIIYSLSDDLMAWLKNAWNMMKEV